MPPKSRKAPPVYFDLETVPDESRAELFGLDPVPQMVARLPLADCQAASDVLQGTVDDVKGRLACCVNSPREHLEAILASEKAAPKPRKGVIDEVAKMIAAIDGEAQAIVGATEARIKKMSVTPEMCRIAALGWAVGDEPVKSLVVGEAIPGSDRTITEIDILDQFWRLAHQGCGRVIGYNIAGFDLPVVLMRTALLRGDDAADWNTRAFDLRPWGEDIVDLMLARWPKGGQPKLKDLVRWLGIEVPADGVDGSNVYPLMQAGQLDQVGQYVRSDVEITRKLHKLYRGLFC